MTKYLFSKIGLVEIKDLLRDIKRSRSVDSNTVAAATHHKQSSDAGNTKVRIHVVLNHKWRKYIQSIKGNHGKYTVKLSSKTDRKHQPTLENLLQDKVYLAAFHSYLQSEFSDENIDFWLACENFRATASSDNLQQKVREIYEEFIQPTASKEINVDHSVREKIKKSLDYPSLTCFNEAQKHVYLLMERDSRPRFLQSSAYLGLKHKSMTL